MLEAPKEILQYLNIHVVGHASTETENLLIPISKNEESEPTVVVAAVPFLKDQDIRTPGLDATTESVEQAVRNGIKAYYQQVAVASEEYHEKGIPIIAMGHLFASGVSVSDSLRNLFKMFFVYQ